ncbi:MAG: YeeE/YedE family protein [Leptospiraceae bacterium]|nr:YeeE/YedE family protein [Leptospiraceae bacterium]
MNHNQKPKPYLSPYIAGIGLGLVLLLSYVSMGRGLGASGAITRFTGYTMNAVAPEHTKNLKYMSSYIEDEKHILNEFLVFLLLGVFVGGFVSGAFGNRVKFMIDKGPHFSGGARLFLAFSGGVISAFGARLARGCTSGQALSGGATLALGSWIFIIGAFAGGYLTAYFVRRQWQ